ncbi:MAG: cheX protein [Caulobacteraceae bacterium]|nr:cheX protein [Caulobacteraceae bacterium]
MGTQNSPQHLCLADALDLNAAGPLAAQLIGLRGASVTLDASQVQRLGGLCLQVLLSARATWAADGQMFQVIDRSLAFDEALSLFGAPRLDVAFGAES